MYCCKSRINKTSITHIFTQPQTLPLRLPAQYHRQLQLLYPQPEIRRRDQRQVGEQYNGAETREHNQDALSHGIALNGHRSYSGPGAIPIKVDHVEFLELRTKGRLANSQIPANRLSSVILSNSRAERW